MKRHQNTQNCRKSEIYICKTCEGLRAVCTNCNDSFNIFSYRWLLFELNDTFTISFYFGSDFKERVIGGFKEIL